MLTILQEPKQVGARIQIARLWSKKSSTEVAALLGVAASTYRGYEAGNGITTSILAQLSVILCVPPVFFERGPVSVIPPGQMTFRKKVRLKSPAALHITAVSSFAVSLRDVIADQINLPRISVPSAKATGIEQVERAVARMRSDLGLADAPLSSALNLAESLGVSVFWGTCDEDFDAVSFWSDERPYIILNETHRDGYRVRFTVLHELGHLVLHRHAHTRDAYEDEASKREADANYFASAWLMPASLFTYRHSPYGSLLDILDDRSYWRASCAAIVRRSKDLRLISEERYRQLYMGISANGWRKKEPGSPPPEESRIHRFFLDEAGEYGLTPTHLASVKGSPVSWFSEAIPLARQYDQGD